MHSSTDIQSVYLRRGIFSFIVLVCSLQIVPPGFCYSPEKAAFSVKFNDAISSYRITPVFVLPGESVQLDIIEETAQSGYSIHSTGGKVAASGEKKWTWEAPQNTGLHRVTLTTSEGTDSIALHVFVMVPLDSVRNGVLNGYRIGTYPRLSLTQIPLFKQPRGLIEVTPENEETLVSPHFRLKQFLCRQEGDYPKYIVLQEKLLQKLEIILEKANEKGYRCSTFNILSGYRTPYYNRKRGNEPNSYHMYGAAADIFIDEYPGDGMMDDLNADGKADYRDVTLLCDTIDRMFSKGAYEMFVGGLGWYKRTTSRSSFVHVDVRGFRYRWKG